MRPLLSRVARVGRNVILAAVVVVTGGSAAWLASAGSSSPAQPGGPVVAASPGEPEKPRRDGSAGIAVPPDVVRAMGLQTKTAETPTRPRKLAPFQGTLAVDNDTYTAVHSRFPGEVVTLGTTAGSDVVSAAARPLRDGDWVKKDQLLAVVWSKDLGLVKSQLVDALSQLRMAELILSKHESAYGAGAIPERMLLDDQRAIEAARVSVQAAERTLLSWRLTDAEIAAVRAEADKLRDKAADADRKPPADWARVEVRAPAAGKIMERNVNVGKVIDTSADLFVLADTTHLAVWAHVFEEDLPLLQSLPTPVKWTLSVPSRPGLQIAGTLDRVADVINPDQHTALVKGRVDNPNGELKVGQYVTVTVELPPPADEVVVPAEAVVEDGRESLVFVQPDPGQPRFVRHKVRVIRRFRDVIYLAAEPAGVKSGDWVVTAGALLLRDAMDQIPRAD